MLSRSSRKLPPTNAAISPEPGALEAGTAPEDRRFRPDVEGLRAVAIVLVVLFHVGIPQVSGGFVGVDVFFVISGFVITGLLLRQSATSGIRVVGFYARRARRILPMALLVIVVSMLAIAVVAPRSEILVTASDGRWSALFLANFHFFAVTPSIPNVRLPSPFQQYWSLAIEEQFYLVYPALFIGILWVPGRWSVRTRLAAGIGAVVVASFVACVLTSHLGNQYAYDSPLTRAWELGIGALVALGTGAAERIRPVAVAAAMTWLGLAAIVASAGYISLARNVYPGWLAAIPVLGTALVIVGGSAVPSMGAESVLGTSPFRSVGRWSYSWYLWHWPFLVIAAELAHTTVLQSSIAKNLGVVLLALAVSAASYRFIEDPIRRSRILAKNHWLTLAAAGALIATSVFLTFAF
jgi:peptidoglycan/LPS O-acetylase OafA/YrhL